MPDEPRYCVQCGREIGDSAVCTNPACEQLPNFYRSVPGPRPAEDDDTRPGLVRSPARAGVGSRVTASSRPTDRSARGPERIAVLRGTSTPAEEHAIGPGTTTIGARAPAKIILDHPQISGCHARNECAMGADGAWKLVVVDSRSTNGTFVNGEGVEHAALVDGGIVRFADVEFRVHMLEHHEPRVTMQL